MNEYRGKWSSHWHIWWQNGRGKNIVIEAKAKLAGKFASENHAGPKDVADFMDLEDEESIEMTKRDAYEQVQALLNLI